MQLIETGEHGSAAGRKKGREGKPMELPIRQSIMVHSSETADKAVDLSVLHSLLLQSLCAKESEHEVEG